MKNVINSSEVDRFVRYSSSDAVMLDATQFRKGKSSRWHVSILMPWSLAAFGMACATHLVVILVLV